MINLEKLRTPTRAQRIRILSAGVWLAIWTLASSVNSSEETAYVLKAEAVVGQIQQIQAAVEVKGELKFEAESATVTRLPLLLNATLRYDEKLVAASPSPAGRRALRYYEEAEAKIKIGDGTMTSQLRPERRIVAAKIDKNGSQLYSPLGPLTRDELDLIDGQGNTLLWDCLLPSQAVKVGERWTVDQDAFAWLLGLDTVTQCDVGASLTKVEGELAIGEVSGTLNGAASGVVSEIRVNAKFNFDLKQRRLTWFAAAFKESRAIGHAEPGLEVTARVRMSAAPAKDSPTLDQKEVAALPATPPTEATLLEFRAEKNQFSLTHDRRWRSILDRPRLCVFRLVERGELIAQCNVSELHDLEKGKSFEAEAFQADIRKSLGESFGQVEEATQTTAGEGKRIFRVVVSGTTGEIPIHWIYYHIADAQGRRAALAYTVETKLRERFADADRVMAESFQFTPRPTSQPDKPQPAEPREAEKRQPKPARS